MAEKQYDAAGALPNAFDWRLLEQADLIKRQTDLTYEIIQKNPTLGFVTAFIMAGDFANAERITKFFENGEIQFGAAQAMIGSYARFEWIVRQVEAKKVKLQDILPDLCNMWSGSDPDDTDHRYLKLWKAAYKAKGETLYDDALPVKWARKRIIRVYRGQDRGMYNQGVLGIAWTTDKNIARKFARGAWARQSDRAGEILHGTIQRKDILAFIQGRGESEVIADPGSVLVTGKENV